MKSLSKIFTLCLYAALWAVIAACQSQAISPLPTTEPNAPSFTETPKPTSSPTLDHIPPSLSPLIQTSEPTSSPTLDHIIPSQSPLIETPEPTLSPTPEENGEPDATPSIQETFPYVEVAKIDSGKLSGIVFHPQRETLFAVSDNGNIIEMESGGTLIRQERIHKDADLEGITYNPVTGLLYLAVEGHEAILEVNPDSLQVMRYIPIDRTFDGGVLLDPKGNGVEGITFVPAGNGEMGGTFFLVNQSKKLEGKDPSIVFEVEIVGPESEPNARIVRYFALGVTDLSGIQYDPSRDQLLVISDTHDMLLEVSLSGQVSRVNPLPGVNQEGITLDTDGFLYIAQDSEEGLLKFSPVKSGDGP